MKIIIQFSNQDSKDKIISQFLSYNNCQANEQGMIVPGVVKINYSHEGITCYCLSLNTVEMILSNVCQVEVESNNNVGYIRFPSELNGFIFETETLDFNKIMTLFSKGTVNYINTEKKELKASVKLSQWLLFNANIVREKSILHFQFLNYEIKVNDGSAWQFCQRVHDHPLIPVSSLNQYFKFGEELKIKPTIEYISFWKVLQSENGYKKYSNVINECKDIANIIYDEGRQYLCEFNGGTIEFQLISIGDKYPKKIIFKAEEIKDTQVIEILKNNFGIKSIDLVAKISNLKLYLQIK